MKHHIRRLITLCLCLAIIAGLIPAISPANEADAATYTSYTTIAKIGTHGGCNAMQGMDVDGTYIYCAKINSDTEKTCAIGRIHKTTGDTVWLTNSATGTYYFSQLAHANDLAVCTVNNVKTMFVGTGGAGKGDYSLVRFSFNGTTLKEVGHYNMKYNGTEKYIAGVKVVATSSTEITLVLKSGNYVYTAKIPYSTTSGDIAMDYLGKLDFSAVNFNGTVKDISNFVVQGFGYKDNKLFVPMTANYQTSTSHISTIVCFDIDGIKGGNIKPDPNMSVWIEDTTYPDLFEIESCAICPTDGKLYFATNCRKTSADGNHDGVHVLKGFVYNPAMGDLTTGQNYHFRTSSKKLKSVTTGASVFNSALQHLGQVSGSNKITGGRWSIDMPIILKHNEPWIVTWEASNWTGNSLLLSTYDTSSFANNYYLYRRAGSDLIAFGYYGSGQYNNYGVNLSSHSIDDTVNHKYQLKNVVNDDGTNMVYLWVDGTILGAMNNYYIDSTSQGKTGNWVSGKDFSFSYIGTAQHPISCTLQSLQVWTQGNINAFDEPNVFRWETQNDKMTPISQFNYTANAVTVLGGSCTGGTYSNYYNRLAQPVVLMHDRPWVVEWKTPSWSGNTMLFSSGDTALKLNASYLYRSDDIVAFGYSDGAKCHSYGLLLADFCIDPAAGHTYRLTNKINADGTNMIYLTVDGEELGPMNRYYLGSEYQGDTSDFVNGKDFTFPYMGNYNYGLHQAYDYIQVWENGFTDEDTPDKYRWEGSGKAFKNITTDGQTANTANRVVGEIVDSVFNKATYRLDTPIVLQHDKRWSISWESSGSWGDTVAGAFLLSASQKTSETNLPYIYRRKNSEVIGFGYYDGTKNVQYGLRLADFGIDGAASHTYTLTNKVAPDGSNMVYLSVDGNELGAMNQYFVGGTAQGTTSDWISGKDFTFPYIGTPKYPLSDVTLNYLEVDEGVHTHSYGNWTVTEAATCTASGSQTRTCSVCGEIEAQSIAATGHSYQAVVTAPTCNATGYTTFTCSDCGDSYTGDSVTATGHSYNAVVTAPTCTADGYTTYTCATCGDSYTGDSVAATGHSFAEGYCTICGAEDPDFVKDYYLFGYINGVNYACEENYADLGIYKFINGKLTATFTSDSYVAVKSADNENWYMTNGWQGNMTSVTLYNTKTNITADKLFVPGGVKVGFVLIDNGDDTFQLSYEIISCPHASHGTDGLCLICGKAIAHSYSSTVTAATCTTDGYTTYTCTVCGTSYIGNQVSATGHSYVNGYCSACGEKDPDFVEVVVPTLTLKYPTLAFEDEILYNAYFAIDDATSIVEMGMITFSSKLTDGTIDDAQEIIVGYSSIGDNYIVHSNGVPAKNLGDALYFKVYALLSDGTYAYSDVAGYNAVVYANTILNSASSSAKAKALVVAMLNYGAAAQVQFNYNTDNLMNATLTAEQLALVSAYDSAMVQDVVKADAVKVGSFVMNGGYSKIWPTVSFEGAFSINYYFTPDRTVDAAPIMYYWDAAAYASVDVLTPENATGVLPMTQAGDHWYAAVDGIVAKAIDETVYVAGCYTGEGISYPSGVIAYSLGNYCKSVAANGNELGAATAVYGYYAKAFFSSNT